MEDNKRMGDVMSGKELIGQLFAFARLHRVPFIPLICSHAAKLEQITTHQMLTDPTQLSKALQNAQTLYNYDAVTCLFDPTLEAEACGCPITWGDGYEMPFVSPHPVGNIREIARINVSDIVKRGRLPIVFEAARRLKIILGRKVAIIGVVTGPLTIAASLIGNDIIRALEENEEETQGVIELAAKVTLEVCKAYCGLELDAIAVAEGPIARLSAQGSDRLCSLLSPVWNVVRFHNAYSILLTNEGDLHCLDYLSNVGADGVVIAAGIKPFDLKAILLQKPTVVFGAAIPSSLLTSENSQTEEWLADCLRAGIDTRFFLTTEWETPSGTYPEKMHAVMNTITRRLQ
jgi:uroporphyrinogen-III decarboxylase